MESNIDKYTYKEVKLLLEKKIITPDELDWNKISVDDLIKLMRDGLLKEQDIPIFCRNHSAGKDSDQRNTSQTATNYQRCPEELRQYDAPKNQGENRRNSTFQHPAKMTAERQSKRYTEKKEEDEKVLISTYKLYWDNIHFAPFELFNYKDYENWLSIWVNLFFQGFTLFLSYKFAEHLKYTSLGIFFLIGLFYISNIAMAARRLNEFNAPKALSALCVYWGIIPLIVLGCLPHRYYRNKKDLMNKKDSHSNLQGNGLIDVIKWAVAEKRNIFTDLRFFWDWKSTLLKFIFFPIIFIVEIIQGIIGLGIFIGLLIVGSSFLSSRFMLGYWSWETLKEIFATIWSIIVNLTI